MILSYNNNEIIKYVFFIIIFFYNIFIKYIYININEIDFIEIDNKFNDTFYENEISFNQYETKFKPIAFYYPDNNYISYYKYFNKSLNKNTIIKEEIHELILAQIKLAKKHGIYGFAIYFNIFENNILTEMTTDILLYNITFPFFLVCTDIGKLNEDDNEIEVIIILLKKYMISSNYIRFKNIPILSIENHSNLTNINNILISIRKIAKKIIGELFLIYPFTGNYLEKNFDKNFDGFYDFSNLDLYKDNNYKHNIRYYSGIIYKNLILNKLSINYLLFRSCYLNYHEFIDYTSEKFYIANKIILEDVNLNLKQNDGIIFVNSWNNYKKGNYIEMDEKYGYSPINSFSKSIFNISFNDNVLKFNYNLNNKSMIAIHIHAFYEDILIKIINRLKNMPLRYDLFISTVSKEKKNFIEKNLKDLNANTIEIRIFDNKGRDIYPFIKQMKSKYKYYKYICHLHTKKSVHKLFLGSNWSEYIYSNLLGNKGIIIDILNDFEINEYLGFIFPENYYEIIKDIKNFDNINLALHIKNKHFMSFLIKKLFCRFKFNEKLVFPVGNMFWAKTKAIYQIFNIRLKYPKELNQINETIMHAIERIWLYLVKLNGYYYKTIFKHY